MPAGIVKSAASAIVFAILVQSLTSTSESSIAAIATNGPVCISASSINTEPACHKAAFCASATVNLFNPLFVLAMLSSCPKHWLCVNGLLNF